MRFQRATLATCSEAKGTVVVLDVLRAFSTAAYAFSAGAREIILTSRVDEARALRERFPETLLMGEVGCLPIQGFNFGNSPSELASENLAGRRLIQRTSSGTQGVVRSVQAETLLASSLVCARATADYLRRFAPESVTFVVTGVDPTERFDGLPISRGDEDVACADYIEALLNGHDHGPASFIQRILESPAGRNLADPESPLALANDLDYCTAADRFGFAMLVSRRDGLLVMEKVEPSG